MAIVKFNPFEEIESLEDRLLGLLRGAGLGMLAATGLTKEETGTEASAWSPAVDIFEDENEYVIKAELPNIDEKDVDLKIENNVLTIRRTKKMEHEEHKEQYRLVESCYGEFSRSFSLPSNIEGERASAKFDKGVLKVVLPKKAESKPKHISIKLS